jgi:hypothetical protein
LSSGCAGDYQRDGAISLQQTVARMKSEEKVDWFAWLLLAESQLFHGS